MSARRVTRDASRPGGTPRTYGSMRLRLHGRRVHARPGRPRRREVGMHSTTADRAATISGGGAGMGLHAAAAASRRPTQRASASTKGGGWTAMDRWKDPNTNKKKGTSSAALPPAVRRAPTPLTVRHARRAAASANARKTRSCTAPLPRWGPSAPGLR